MSGSEIQVVLGEEHVVPFTPPFHVIDMPGSPGFSYFLGTPCKEWDSYMYHEAWKNAGLSMNKNTLMRAFNKQVELIKYMAQE
ncbi:5885_t:CDS:2 [Entrophospora sp. SA101]|nr:5885_t:CDS:2 [Entrophospora sp. SA101]